MHLTLVKIGGIVDEVREGTIEDVWQGVDDINARQEAFPRVF